MNVTAVLEKIRAVPKRTSAGASIGLFGLFLLIFPNALNEKSQEIVMYIIQALGATGVADWIWRNRKEAIAYIKKLLTKKN